MKKSFIYFVTFLFIAAATFYSCSNLNGPERDVTLENRTDIDQDITLIINDTKEETVTIPALKTVHKTVIGGFQVKPLSDFRYTYSFSGENSVYITYAKQTQKTIINNLPIAVTLIDTAVPEFSVDVPANSSKDFDVYFIDHKFTLKNSKEESGFRYLEDANNKYFYTIKNNGVGILVSAL